MKITKIDRLGRIVIPIHYRRDMGIEEDTPIMLEYINKKLIISAGSARCCVCGSKIKSNLKMPLCDDCVECVKMLK